MYSSAHWVLLYLNGSRAEALMIPASLFSAGYGIFLLGRTQQAKHGATADYQTESTGTKIHLWKCCRETGRYSPYL